MPDITTIVYLTAKAYAVYKAITSNSDCESGYDCWEGPAVDIYQEHDKSAYSYANIISTPYGPVYSYSRTAGDQGICTSDRETSDCEPGYNCHTAPAVEFRWEAPQLPKIWVPGLPRCY